MAALRDVFGIYNPPPLYTYVDRAGLDERIRHFLGTGRHLVIHGPSKQGKTALRKRALAEDDCIVVHCRNRPTIEQIYNEAFSIIDSSITTSETSSVTKEFSGNAEAKISGGILGFLTGEGKASGGGKAAVQHSTTTQQVGASTSNLRFVASTIAASRRRLILEDFHYVSESEKKTFAQDLKSLYELYVPVILVGAWEQQDLLPQYNGDLTGKIDEINVRWTDAELNEVLTKGERALNLRISRGMKNLIVQDASGNVGLLHRLAEKLCMENSCLVTHPGARPRRIASTDKLVSARKHICRQEASRYRTFGWSVAEGFANSSPATKQIYMYIIRTCVEASDSELLAGLPQQLIEDRIVAMSSEIKRSSIRAALLQIDKLQSDKAIYPVIATFDQVNKVLNLADRELLFYRKYGGPRWPWEDSDE